MADAEILLTGFDPVVPATPRILILGSMPSEASLQQTEYYAHPRNAFWPIMRKLFGLADDASYAVRLESLRHHGIALWDVVHRCRRKGSLDADIDPTSIEYNDIIALLRQHENIRAVFCNGGASAQLFARRFAKPLKSLDRAIDTIRLPSTSPANARLTLEQKYAAWQQITSWL